MTEQNDSSKKSTSDISITGRFDQYRSSYWAAAVAVLGVRYAPRPFLRKHWDAPESSHIDKHKYAGLAGTFMQGVAGYYALRTWQDMKSIFSQTIAWELDKDPKDVTFSDFRNSKNSIVQQTTQNYMRYNLRRFAVNSTFFIPFILQPFFKNQPWFKAMHAETGVDFGMASNAAYLFSDVISRKITPFEEIQSLIDRKINQSDHYADQINAHDLVDVYERHAAGGSVSTFLKKRGTEEWPQVMQLFDRMAGLMNQTYRNEVPHEKADFGFPKFIYLVGNGMIQPDNIEQSLAYVEIANKHGTSALKKAVQEMKDGVPLDKVMEEYSVVIPPLAKDDVVLENTPSSMLSSGISVQVSNNDNLQKFNAKDDMPLAFKDKIRHQQIASSSDRATV